jgi:uncharacterized membrane protein
VSDAVAPPQVEVPTPEVIVRALGSVEIAAINQAISSGKGITFVSEVAAAQGRSG